MSGWTEASITADQVLPGFRKKAYLLGRIPWQCSTVDPRIPYALYIPEEAYNDPARTRKVPLLAYIHGTRRDTSAIHGSLKPFADATRCAVLAPLFPVGLEHPNDISSYKYLYAKSYRADTVLLSILDEVRTRWNHIETRRFFLMGFSGGGQFAHRFLYLYPRLLLGVSIGAPGNITVLDEQKDWPEGLGDVDFMFGTNVNIEDIQRVPIQLVIGEDDNVPSSGEKEASWNAVDEHMPEFVHAMVNELRFMRIGRRDTIEYLRDRWTDLGIDADLQVVPGVGHSHTGVEETMLSFFRALLVQS
ncbi:hypothetical protein MBLNU457_6910t1 [Dothideomycetes sp. NU457]